MGCLTKKLHDNVKTFIGMMHKNILVLNGGKTIAVEITDAFGKSGRKGRKFKVWPLIENQFGKIGHAKQGFDLDNIFCGGADFFGDKAAQIGGHACLNGKPDDVATPAAF